MRTREASRALSSTLITRILLSSQLSRFHRHVYRALNATATAVCMCCSCFTLPGEQWCSGVCEKMLPSPFPPIFLCFVTRHCVSPARAVLESTHVLQNAAKKDHRSVRIIDSRRSFPFEFPPKPKRKRSPCEYCCMPIKLQCRHHRLHSTKDRNTRPSLLPRPTADTYKPMRSTSTRTSFAITQQDDRFFSILKPLLQSRPSEEGPLRAEGTPPG